jgi:hypothetical protein
VSERDGQQGVPNRRSRRRVAAEKLPEGLREFRLEFSPEEVYTGSTIDASLTSISFFVEVSANRIREHLVHLTSADGSITMTQELVYVKPVDESRSRISFMYSAASTPQLYRRIISQALKE